MTDLVTMTFINRDALKVETSIKVDRASAGIVAQWYGAFHAGDDYSVQIDGVEVMADANGALAPL